MVNAHLNFLKLTRERERERERERDFFTLKRKVERSRSVCLQTEGCLVASLSGYNTQIVASIQYAPISQSILIKNEYKTLPLFVCI